MNTNPACWKQRILRLIVPYIPLCDLFPMIAVSTLGAALTGLYGVLHDQVTYTISPEYFINFKFYQFDYADFGFHERVFVGFIGFLATWWVGFFCVWFLARRLMPAQPRDKACRQIAIGFLIFCFSGIVFSAGGYVYGLLRGPEIDYSYWGEILRRLHIKQPREFVRVAYMHNASYLGGIVGLVLALLLVRPTAKGETRATGVDRV